MKEKTIIFLVGLLLGAIISTGSIYIYTIANKSNDYALSTQKHNDFKQDDMMKNGDNPPEMPNDNKEL